MERLSNKLKVTVQRRVLNPDSLSPVPLRETAVLSRLLSLARNNLIEWVSNINVHDSLLEDLVEYRLVDLTPRVFDSIDVEQEPKILHF